jgi:FtsP/CotA-like multicopper oxidase with cupredoxin domain
MLSRRAILVSSLAAAAVRPPTARAQPAPAPGQGETAAPKILQLQRRTIEVNGKPASVFAIRQPGGSAGIVTEVGTQFRVLVENRIDQASLIHWHGLAPPWQQDGVPGISGPPIPPSGSADYDFPLRFGGTFWMHSHQGLQEQSLMAAPLIIRDGRDIPGQQEIVMMLNDFSFTPPEEIMAGLRKGGRMPVTARMAAPARKAGMAQGDAPDLNDVKYDAFLANDRTLADPEVVQVEPGTTVLLRVINGSSMSNYHLDLGRLKGELIAVDGFRIVPVLAGRFPITVAQRLDIRLAAPREAAFYPVLAVLEGERRQTGIVLAVGRPAIARAPEMASALSPALTLDLERRLRAARPLKSRKADRVHTLNLTGDMEHYIWSINNVAWNTDVPPPPIAKGERAELVMINQTRMPHPMHLHGPSSRLSRSTASGLPAR